MLAPVGGILAAEARRHSPAMHPVLARQRGAAVDSRPSGVTATPPTPPALCGPASVGCQHLARCVPKLWNRLRYCKDSTCVACARMGLAPEVSGSGAVCVETEHPQRIYMPTGLAPGRFVRVQSVQDVAPDVVNPHSTPRHFDLRDRPHCAGVSGVPLTFVSGPVVLRDRGGSSTLTKQVSELLLVLFHRQLPLHEATLQRLDGRFSPKRAPRAFEARGRLPA